MVNDVNLLEIIFIFYSFHCGLIFFCRSLCSHKIGAMYMWYVFTKYIRIWSIARTLLSATKYRIIQADYSRIIRILATAEPHNQGCLCKPVRGWPHGHVAHGWSRTNPCGLCDSGSSMPHGQSSMVQALMDHPDMHGQSTRAWSSVDDPFK